MGGEEGFEIYNNTVMVVKNCQITKKGSVKWPINPFLIHSDLPDPHPLFPDTNKANCLLPELELLM